jgi:hypothetical protein
VVRGGGGGGVGGGGTRRDTVRATEPDRLLLVVLGTAGGSALARAPQYGGGGGAPAGRRAARAAPSHLCSRRAAARRPTPATRDRRLTPTTSTLEAHGTHTKCAPPHPVVCFCFFFLVDWPLGNICSVSHLQRKHPLEFLNVFSLGRESRTRAACASLVCLAGRDETLESDIFANKMRFFVF